MNYKFILLGFGFIFMAIVYYQKLKREKEEEENYYQQNNSKKNDEKHSDEDSISFENAKEIYSRTSFPFKEKRNSNSVRNISDKEGVVSNNKLKNSKKKKKKLVEKSKIPNLDFVRKNENFRSYSLDQNKLSNENYLQQNFEDEYNFVDKELRRLNKFISSSNEELNFSKENQSERILTEYTQ
jgi:hypothetical protein